MSQAELLKLVIDVLNQLGIDAMLVGSHASSYYGEARTTHDIDLVIDLPSHLIDELVGRFPAPRYYLSAAALREGRMANLIDTEMGDKVDLWLLSDDAGAQAEFARRQTAVIMSVTVPIATAEDTVIAKLRWSKQMNGSEQQLTDVREIIRQQHDQLDFPYLNERIALEDLRAEWDKIDFDSLRNP